MKPFGMDSGWNNSVILQIFIVFSMKNGIILVGSYSKQFHNTCLEQDSSNRYIETTAFEIDA